jgi:hypothetical protein
MKAQTKRLAVCAMTTALCVVLMWLGSVLDIGMYVSPIVSGFLLIPIRKQYGYKYLIAAWTASGLLSLILVPNIEQNLLYIGLFGWYPALREHLHKLPGLLRVAAKLLIFNAIVVLGEALVVNVLAPEIMPSWLAVLLLVLANITFILYDYLLPRIEMLLSRFSKFY